MSTLATTNLKNPSSGTNNIELETNGNVTATGTVSAATVTSSGDVNDSIGDVRSPKFTTLSTSTEITASGVYRVTAAATITFGTAAGELEAGDIVVIYNDHSAGITIEDGDFTTFVKDGEASDNTSLTLAADSLATITVLSATKAVISSGNLS